MLKKLESVLYNAYLYKHLILYKIYLRINYFSNKLFILVSNVRLIKIVFLFFNVLSTVLNFGSWTKIKK